MIIQFIIVMEKHGKPPIKQSSNLLERIFECNSHYLENARIGVLTAAFIIVLESLQLLGLTSTRENIYVW